MPFHRDVQQGNALFFSVQGRIHEPLLGETPGTASSWRKKVLRSFLTPPPSELRPFQEREVTRNGPLPAPLHHLVGQILPTRSRCGQGCQELSFNIMGR